MKQPTCRRLHTLGGVAESAFEPVARDGQRGGDAFLLPEKAPWRAEQVHCIIRGCDREVPGELRPEERGSCLSGDSAAEGLRAPAEFGAVAIRQAGWEQDLTSNWCPGWTSGRLSTLPPQEEGAAAAGLSPWAGRQGG